MEGVLVMEQFHVVRKELTASAIPGFFLVFSGVIEDQVIPASHWSILIILPSHGSELLLLASLLILASHW